MCPLLPTLIAGFALELVATPPLARRLLGSYGPVEELKLAIFPLPTAMVPAAAMALVNTTGFVATTCTRREMYPYPLPPVPRPKGAGTNPWEKITGRAVVALEMVTRQ